MEIYREESQVSSDRQILMWGTLALILICFAYEAYITYTTHAVSVLGWGYSFVFLGMWIWRCVFKYTYILKENELTIISHGIGIRRSYSVDLAATESLSNKYVRSFFRKTKISHYIHRYSSVDDNPQRLLTFREGKKQKLAAVIFKCSDRFLKEMLKIIPRERFIELM